MCRWVNYLVFAIKMNARRIGSECQQIKKERKAYFHAFNVPTNCVWAGRWIRVECTLLPGTKLAHLHTHTHTHLPEDDEKYLAGIVVRLWLVERMGCVVAPRRTNELKFFFFRDLKNRFTQFALSLSLSFSFSHKHTHTFYSLSVSHPQTIATSN